MTTSSLQQRLLDAEQEFLAARDSAAVEALARKWDVLCDDFQHALEQDVVDDDVKEVARVVFYRVAILGESLLDLQEKADAFEEDLSKLLADLTINDVLPPPPTPLRTPAFVPHSRKPPTSRMAIRTPQRAKPPYLSQPRSKPHTNPRPPFVAPAYTWILENFHNPYPSSEISRTIADAAGSSPSSIKKWFKSIRTYIGWEALCKHRFAGQRTFAVTAAKRVFCPADSQSGLPSEIARDILAVKTKLDGLYADELCHEPIPSAGSSLIGHQRRESSSSDTSIEFLFASSSTSSPPSSPSSLGSSSSNSSRVPSLVFSASDYDSEGCEGSAQQSSQDNEYCGVNAFTPQLAALDALNAGSGDDHLRPVFCGAIGESSQSTPSTSNSRKRRSSDEDESWPRKRTKQSGSYTSRPYVVPGLGLENLISDFSQPSATHVQQVTAPDCSTFSQHTSGQNCAHKPIDNTNLPQSVNVDLFRDAQCGAVPLYAQGMAQIWASDERSLSEMVRDAPSSTTLKLLPLPETDFSDGLVSIEQWNGDEPSDFSASKGRELPPIHWSSSSLAGALGPLDQEPKRASEPTAPAPTAEVISPETSKLEPQTSTLTSLDTATPSLSSNTPLWADLSPSNWSGLGDAEFGEDASLQQLLDLLDSPQYPGFAF